MRNVYDSLKINRLTHQLFEPRKRSNDMKHLSRKIDEIEKERKFVRGSLRILYGIEPDD